MLKRILSLAVAVILTVTGIHITPSNSLKVDAAETGWTLVWSDEFNGTSLDRSVWNYDIGTGDWGWGNGEIQYYTDKADNVSVSDGSLKITAKRENYNGSAYTSGRINTLGKKAFKYGKMEARIKEAGGNQNGVWPAFWMMGNNMASGTNWPYCGELDIMEHANNRNYVEGTLHWNAGGIGAGYNHVFWGSYSGGQYYYFPDNVNNGINGWHTYGVIWDEQKIQWYVDDNIYLTGYLTKAQTTIDTDELPPGMMELKIPNAEIKEIFETTVVRWFDESAKTWNRKTLFDAIWSGDCDRITQELTALLRRTIS